MIVAIAGPEDRPAAHDVWRAANEARRRPPSPARIARVHAKLADPASLVVVGRDDGVVAAMAVAEPLRADLGIGVIVEGWAHVSMVFVDPARWGQGLGGQLLEGLHRVAEKRGWESTSLWTRESNERAQRLYERHGYELAGGPELGRPDDRFVRYLRAR